VRNGEQCQISPIYNLMRDSTCVLLRAARLGGVNGGIALECILVPCKTVRLVIC